MAISAQLAASRKYKQNSVWAKTFIDLAEELPQVFLKQEQLDFVLLAALKTMNTNEFTQSFS